MKNFTVLILGLFLVFYACGVRHFTTGLSRSYDSVKDQEVISMTREYRSIESQRNALNLYRYTLNIQWSKVSKGTADVKGFLTLIEPQQIMPDLQDTLFIRLPEMVIKAPFLDYDSSIERIGNEEKISERKRHQASFQLNPQQQRQIAASEEITFRLYAQDHTYTFVLSSSERQLLRKLCNDGRVI